MRTSNLDRQFSPIQLIEFRASGHRRQQYEDEQKKIRRNRRSKTTKDNPLCRYIDQQNDT